MTTSTKSRKPTATRYLHHAILLCAGLLLVTPLLITTSIGLPTIHPHLFGKAILNQSLIQILFALWLILITMDRSYLPSLKQPLVKAIHLFFIVLILTQFFSVDFHRSFWSPLSSMNGLWHHLHWWALFTVLSSTVRKPSQWLHLLSVCAGTSILAGAYTLTQWAQDGFTRADGVFGNSLHSSSYTLIALAFSIALLGSKKRAIRILGILALVTNGLTLLATSSRSSLLAATGAMIVLLVCYLGRKKTNRRRLWITAGTATLVLGAIVGVSLYTPHLNHLTSTTVTDRVDLARIAVTAITQKPLTGWGLNTFSVPLRSLYDQGTYPGLLQGFYEDAHNAYLELASSAGIVTLILWLLILALAAQTLHTRLRTTPDTFILAALMAALAAQATQDLFFSHTHYTSLLLFFLLAAVAHQSNPATNQPTTPWLAQSWMRLGAMSLIAAAMLFSLFQTGYLPAQSQLTITQQIDVITSADYQTLLENYQTAKEFSSPWFMDEQLFMTTGVSTGLLTYHLDDEPSKQFATIFAQDLEKATKDHPSNYKLALSAARIFAADDALQDQPITRAQLGIEQARALAPGFHATDWTELEIALHFGEYTQATQALVALAPNVSGHLNSRAFNFHKSAILYAIGELDEGTSSLQTVLAEGYPVFASTIVFDSLVYAAQSGEAIPEEPLSYVYEFVRRNPRAYIYEQAARFFVAQDLPAQEEAFKLLRVLDADRADRLTQELYPS